MTGARHLRGRGCVLPRLVLLGMALLQGGCSDPEPSDGASATPSGMVISGDDELRRLTEALVPLLAERAGLPLLEPVRVERRTRGELLGYVRDRLDQDLPQELANLTTRAYGLFGLVPMDLDLRGLLKEVYEEQVAGFYDPASSTLFVLDDQPPETLEPLLLHELVHALQDQHVDLDALTAVDQGNDRRLAARAAIEGHATLVMLAWMAEQGGSAISPEDLPGLAGLLRPDEATLASQYPALSGAPPVFRETLLFPYVEGAAFVQAVWRAREGRPAPFGDHLPLSTEQVFEWTGEGAPDPPVPVEVPRIPGTRVLLENSLGALESRILVEALGVTRGGGGGAPGWGGDRWALLESEEGVEGLLWVSVWDTVADRDRYADDLARGLGSRTAPARMWRAEIDGRPGILFGVGAGTAFEGGLTAGEIDGG